MGTRGPIPQRSDQRVRRNKPDVPIEKVTPLFTPSSHPELDLDDPHPIVRDLYRSLVKSAQSKFYEPSDWQFARFTLHFADKLLKSPRPSGQMLATVNQMLGSLLVTEGERRRVQIEVERNKAEGEVVDIAEMYRERLSRG